MKKKGCIVAICVALFLILFAPIPKSPYKDGGTREYAALTYKIVDWNKLTDDASIYEATKVYFFPNNFRSIDNLWYYEKDNVPNMFVGKVVLIGENFVEVEPLENEEERSSTDRITIGTANLENIGVVPGSFVEVTYSGAIMESYPAQINATSWKMAGNLRFLEYTDQWLDKQTAEKSENSSAHIRITRIYSNCFFASNIIPLPYELKINGTLSEEWCVGDQVLCAYENVYYDWDNNRMEADMVSIEQSDFELDPNGVYKPVIYLYPEEETDVTVKLLLDGKLTCTYPSYNSGWRVTAAPDGTLTDRNGQTYNYLYWEGETGAQWDMSEGFCVKGTDTAVFLEDALSKLGLNRREANEFIVYWLPLMQENPYNIISFQTDRYTEAARLNVSPAPDTTIRVFMTWQASDTEVNIPAQELTAPERIGFTLVEWGGTEAETKIPFRKQTSGPIRNDVFTDEFFADVVEIRDFGTGVVSGDQMESVIRYLQGLTLCPTDKHLRTVDKNGNQLYGCGGISFVKNDGTEIHVLRNHVTLTGLGEHSYVAEGVNLNVDLKEAFGNQYCQ